MSLEQVAAALREHDRFLVTAHINPDGDSLGSQLAMAGLLRDMGKEVSILNHNRPGENYRFLPDIGDVLVCGKAAVPSFEAVIVLDAGEWGRIGSVADIADAGRHFVINLDHHASNEGFGNAAYVDTAACSTAILVFRLYRLLDVPIGPASAAQLYTGILTDTGGFRFNNTTAETLEVCGRLITAGADPAAIMEKTYFTRSILAVHVFRKVLDTLELHAEGRVATVRLRGEAVADLAPHTPEDIWAATDGIIDYIRSIEGVRIAIFFREETEGMKISLRSVNDNLNVNALARKYEGGGHAQAAGAFVTGDPDETVRLVTAQAAAMAEA